MNKRNRDGLVELLVRATEDGGGPEEVADAILAAGWRRMAHTGAASMSNMDAAKVLKASPSTVRVWVTRGKLERTGPGMISLASINRMIRDQPNR